MAMKTFSFRLLMALGVACCVLAASAAEPSKSGPEFFGTLRGGVLGLSDSEKVGAKK